VLAAWHWWIRFGPSLAEIGVGEPVLAILPCVAVVGHHRGDALVSSAQRIDVISSSLRLSVVRKLGRTAATTLSYAAHIFLQESRRRLSLSESAVCVP